MNYLISVVRTKTDRGVLTFTKPDGTAKAYECAWDPPDKIPAGSFPGGSATWMNSAKNSKGGKREAIFLPNVPGRTGIFIHYWPGKNLKVWSDGCILLLEPDLLEIWNAISPVNGRNVDITVSDSPSAAGQK
jgi:hypothetical protein